MDTGFTEYLSLPADLISALGLPFLQSDAMMLSDGIVANFLSYDAAVSWDGQQRRVVVQSGEGSPVVGLALLKDQLLGFPVRSGETVTITPLS